MSFPRPGHRARFADVAAAALFLAAAFGPVPMLAPVAIVVLIASLDTASGPVARFLASKPVWWLGEVSFSIYLLHQPLLHIVGHIQPRLTGFMGQGAAASATVMLVIGTTLVASAVTNRLIEVPARRLGKRIAQRRSPAAVAA